ncbi:hypothetical protein [Rhodalgimonas zhirmunskyi]|uniref:Uncharacterized protein n=1 Tax=Rhodalgimonas zhirmunskyi TaxID=2964767 RepID=A0AAJ1X6P9_9RHOB|nr:hypothetical protein [Rhodoalgimonas zhirmunskyi]MDQ2093697.1 hypothetical protein [Rhodoalgimonas zhirmunskyi]
MDRLAFFNALMAGPAIAGTLIVVAFSFGLYGPVPIIVSVVVAAIAAVPAGAFVSRLIKRDDPNWNPDHKPGDYGLVPPADAPEV